MPYADPVKRREYAKLAMRKLREKRKMSCVQKDGAEKQ